MNENNSPSPLDASQQEQLSQACREARPISRIARVATFNGWVCAGLAAVSLPFALFSLIGLLMTAGLMLVARNEFRGSRMVKTLDPAGPRLLGWNQVGFLSLILAYCFWQSLPSRPC